MKRPELFVLVVLALTSIGAATGAAQAGILAADEVENGAEPGSALGAGDSPIQDAAGAPALLRVGTFDSRVVALAYYRSELGIRAARDLHAELKEATESRDKKRVKQLEAKGPALQNLMHQQVFGNLSIPNVLKLVSESLPGIAAEAGVSLLVSKWEIQYGTSDVELIDLTPQLVELFDLDEATRSMIDEILKGSTEPIPIEQLLDPHD